MMMSISSKLLDNKILTALKKCEAAAFVEPPKSEVLASSTMLPSTSPSTEETRQSHINQIESKSKFSLSLDNTFYQMFRIFLRYVCCVKILIIDCDVLLDSLH